MITSHFSSECRRQHLTQLMIPREVASAFSPTSSVSFVSFPTSSRPPNAMALQAWFWVHCSPQLAFSHKAISSCYVALNTTYLLLTS